MLESTDIDCETAQVHPDTIVFGGFRYYKV